MKIRKGICRFLTFVLICTSFSCSDEFFNEPTGSRITPGEHYKSQKDLYINFYGSYIPLQKAMPDLLLIDGLRSDIMDITDNSDAYMKEIYNHEISVNNPYIDGSDYYKAIININEALEHFDQVWIIDPSDNPTEANQMKGSFISLRSWNYFMLVKLFGKSAYIKDNMATFQNNQVFEKRVMIDTLINQLKPYVIASAAKKGELWFAGPNIKALIGELYLENQVYDSAAYYLKLGMESFDNTANFGKVTKQYSKENWKTLFFNDGPGGLEIIDEVGFDTYTDQYNSFTGWTLNNIVKPTQLLINTFESQYVIKDTIAGDKYRGRGITYDYLPGTTDAYISKYNLLLGLPYSSPIIISRAADIHLLLAEALNQLGDTTGAMLLLNNGISSADVKPAGYEKWSTNTGIRGRVSLTPYEMPETDITNTIEDYIITEREMELAYEGKRWFDLVRVATRRNDPSYLAGKVAAKYSDPAKAAEIYNKLLNPANWYLPVK